MKAATQFIKLVVEYNYESTAQNIWQCEIGILFINTQKYNIIQAENYQIIQIKERRSQIAEIFAIVQGLLLRSLHEA